jgi:hypothetical protein
MSSASILVELDEVDIFQCTKKKDCGLDSLVIILFKI